MAVTMPSMMATGTCSSPSVMMAERSAVASRCAGMVLYRNRTNREAEMAVAMAPAAKPNSAVRAGVGCGWCACQRKIMADSKEGRPRMTPLTPKVVSPPCPNITA